MQSLDETMPFKEVVSTYFNAWESLNKSVKLAKKVVSVKNTSGFTRLKICLMKMYFVSLLKEVSLRHF